MGPFTAFDQPVGARAENAYDAFLSDD